MTTTSNDARCRFRTRRVLAWAPQAAIALTCLLGASALAQEAAPGITQPGAPAQPGAPELREEQIQDWALRCGGEGAEERCEMLQQNADAEGNTLALVVIGALPGREELGMLVLMPLGIILPAGVTLTIDDGPEVPLQVQRCIQGSCQIERLLEPPLLDSMKAGTRATITYAVQNQQGQVGRVQANLSLLGFTAALNRIQG